MTQQNFAIDLDDTIYQAALERAQAEGKTVEQVLVDLLAVYAEGKTGVITYTVQRGDTLAKIARQVYGDSHQYALIQKANNLADPGKIWVGQVLVIPSLAGAISSPAPTAPSEPSPSLGPSPLPEPLPPHPPAPLPPEPTPPPVEPTVGPQPWIELPPEPPPTGTVNPTLLNGSFDDYQPYHREGEDKVWKESQFPERYGADWDLELISEEGRRIHLMDSGTFGLFTQKYFGGGGRDYHIHGRHSQVVTSRYGFDLVFMQTVTAEPGRDYTFSGSIVSFYKGTSGERADGKIFKTLGLDPTGGRDWSSSSVIWAERDGKDNEWRYPALRVTAQAKAITVFIRLENTERDVGQTELNIIHLDNFKLE